MPGASNQDAIITKWDETSTLRGYRLVVENDDADSTGNFQVEIYDESADQAIVATGANDTVSEDTWYHVVFTFNGGTSGTADDLNLFVNSIHIDGNAANGSFAGLEDVAVDFSVGDYDATDAVSNNSAFTGIIDHIQLFATELSQAQVSWLYKRGRPIGHWKFDECQGTVATDASGNGNNGTITPGDTSGDNDSAGACDSGASDPTNDMWNDGTNGKRNASLGFDGTNDYVDMDDPDSLELEMPFTLSAWVKINQLPSIAGDDFAVVSKYINSSTNNFVWQIETNDDLALFKHDGTSGEYIPGVINFSSSDVGNWVHVAFTIDISGNADWYRNGLRVDGGTASSSNMNTSTAADFWIGAREAGGSGDNFFEGQIDEVKIFNYALTEQQVKNDYNAGAVYFGP
jgi:hypothetical protein